MTQAETVNKGIQWELLQWARWARMNGIVLAPKSPMLTLLRQIAGTVLPTPLITDDRAMQIESAIRDLGARHEHLGDVIKLYYLGNYSDYKIADKIGCSSTGARQLRLRGEHWLDGALNR